MTWSFDGGSTLNLYWKTGGLSVIFQNLLRPWEPLSQKRSMAKEYGWTKWNICSRGPQAWRMTKPFNSVAVLFVRRWWLT